MWFLDHRSLLLPVWILNFTHLSVRTIRLMSQRFFQIWLTRIHYGNTSLKVKATIFMLCNISWWSSKIFCNFNAPNSPSKDEKLVQLMNSFSDHAQGISQEMAPQVSSCLSLDTRCQELTRQAISDCSVEPGSFVEPTQDPDFSDIVQELHQNFDEKSYRNKNADLLAL